MRGFTLLEVVVATALLASLGLALSGWMRFQGRLIAGETRRLRILRLEQRLCALIRDDLMLAAARDAGSPAWQVDAAGRLHVTTLNRTSDAEPGFATVCYFLDTGVLYRGEPAAAAPPRPASGNDSEQVEEPPRPDPATGRPLAGGLAACSFAADGGRLRCAYRLVAAEEPRSIDLWQGDR